MWVSSCSAMRTFIIKSCKILARLVYFMPSHSNLFWLSKRLIFPMPQWYYKYSRSLSTVFNDTLLQYNVLAFSSLASNCGRIEIWKYVIFEVSCLRSWANKKYTPQFCSLGSVRFFLTFEKVCFHLIKNAVFFYFNILRNVMYSFDAKLNFQHHYSSLRYHLQKSF